MKISIITVCLNAAATLEDTILSVLNQTYPNIEYILIDGASSDQTMEVVKKYNKDLDFWISQPDNGIYDAMNRGIKHATGDIIGFLNADDVFADRDSVQWLAKELSSQDIDACYADLVYVTHLTDEKAVRHYSSKHFSPQSIAYGIMPAHPTLYVKRKVFEKYGFFKTDYKIAADFEFVARVFGTQQIRAAYLPKILVKMRTGGVSTAGIKNNIILNREIVRACRCNNIATNYIKVYLKYFKKVFELIHTPYIAR